MTTAPEAVDPAVFASAWRGWRAERDRAIAAPGGILEIVALSYLTASPTRVPDLPGLWSSEDGGVRVDLADDEGLFDGGDRVTGSALLPRPDGGAVLRAHDGLIVELQHASGWDIVRVRDPQAPAVLGYTTTPAYDPDPAWRVPGRWIERRRALEIATVSERITRHVESPGIVEFELGGRTHRLIATPAHGTDSAVVLLFRDRTSGVTTYGAQRELRVELPVSGDEVVVDFNRAYNKPCAYSDFALCPLPPDGNVLDVAVEAGERIPLERGGADVVAGDAPDRTTDRSGLVADGEPSEVVIARDVAQVRETVRRAAATGTPIVTRGAGSGLAGGAVAVAGAVVLDLSGLDRIVSIDPVDGTATVEPGVITADLDRAAREHGLIYAPDPGSVGISTIGGNIATNAGGLRGAKYGVTRDAVLQVDVVLADGSLVRLGRPTIKGVTGYDLAGLVIGSEGTLGIVVGATVRLLPRPPRVATASAFFATLEDAAAGVAALAVSGARPAVLEIVDGATLQAIDDAEGTDLRAQGEALLIAQTDGFGAEEEISVVVKALSLTAASVDWTGDETEADRLLTARRQALPAIERIGRPLIEDIAVPRSRLAEAIRRVREVSDRLGVPIFVFGHAGDGNLHPIIVADADDNGEIPEIAHRAADEVFAIALELGGTVTAEHGVGRLKREWARRELGAASVALHESIKRVFDPAGILNPGSSI